MKDHKKKGGLVHRLTIVLLSVGVIFALCFGFVKHKVDAIEFVDGFTYTAHTGCVDTKDNSLEAIETGVLYGADIVEFDVRYYKGNPVLAHDKPNGKEISLEKAFLKVKEYEGLRVNVDIKSVEHLYTVGEAAEKTGVKDRIFFTGINEEDVARVKEDCPDIDYYLNVSVLPKRKQTDEYLLSLVNKVKDCGAIGINLNKDNATKELVEIFHQNGLLVSIWTVNDFKDIYKVLSFEPDNITTRRPDRLQKVLADMNYGK